MIRPRHHSFVVAWDSLICSEDKGLENAGVERLRIQSKSPDTYVVLYQVQEASGR